MGLRDIPYKTFSWNTHKKKGKLNKLSVCQFELTFGCHLHCRHCYADCYNKPPHLKKELSIEEVKIILNKVYRAGAIWLFFTGGDPLTRKDFLKIYSFAQEKGFIITIFTNGYSMTQGIAEYFKRRPPFVIEITLNAVREDLYEKMSQVKGSFAKVMRGIDLILKEKLPLKIKTQVSRDNLEQLPKIKKFIEGLGLKFRPSYLLHPRLNGDLAPCNLRISPEEILNFDGKKSLPKDDCGLLPQATANRLEDDLFRCAVKGGGGIHIDPYGNTFVCNLIRKPSFNLLEFKLQEIRDKLLASVRKRKFTTVSKCKNCNLRRFCLNCPGKAYLETADMEAPVSYYCKLAKETIKPHSDLTI